MLPDDRKVSAGKVESYPRSLLVLRCSVYADDR